MDEVAEHSGKTTFTNFKRVIWHESFRKILESLSVISQIGFMVECGDGTRRRLYPFVHILSADYEEQ